jgi:hypothetical protein
VDPPISTFDTRVSEFIINGELLGLRRPHFVSLLLDHTEEKETWIAKVPSGH